MFFMYCITFFRGDEVLSVMHYFVNSFTSRDNWMKVAAVPVGALLWNSVDGWRRHICWRREKSLERIWDVSHGSESHLCFCLQLTFFLFENGS